MSQRTIAAPGPNMGMIPAERQQLIIEYLSLNRSAKIKELALYFGVSEATVRRDLDELASDGKLNRAHGGAIPVETSTSFERIYSEKMLLMREEKERIAISAAKLVKNGDTVLLDSGTTTFLVAKALAEFEDLIVITNDLHIADTVALHDSSSMLLTGGLRRGNDYHVLQGSMVDEFIRSINVNIVFLSADAISKESGVSNATMAEAITKKLMLKAGKQKVLVTDHTKFGQTALSHVCQMDQLDYLITDDGLDQDSREWLNTCGVQMILV